MNRIIKIHLKKIKDNKNKNNNLKKAVENKISFTSINKRIINQR